MGFAELSEQAARIAALPGLSLNSTTRCSARNSMMKSGSSIRSFSRSIATAPSKAAHPSLEYFDFGGGVPVPYSLDFDFDYARFARLLLAGVRDVCAAARRRGTDDRRGVRALHDGAEHGAHLFQVVEEKATAPGDAQWYIVDSSLMVALPDSWGIGQKFIVLPFNGYDRPPRRVWLGGLTCDSDDVYREAGTPGYPTLPQTIPR